MPRVAIAGFQHETNSFSSVGAGLAEFETADSWPGMLEGAAVVEETRGLNLPIAGFAEAADESEVDLLPILWCSAEPSGPVSDEAFETISGDILDGIRRVGPLDGLYLDLHGAMITERFDDGEGELLARVREVAGPQTPIAVSLDMHANVSSRTVALADALCIYRTYPHLDMAATGVRAWRRLRRILDGVPSFRAFRQAPFLVPLHAQHTGSAPARELYAALPDDSTVHVEMALGFTAGDTADCGPSIVAHAPAQSEADVLADRALDRLCAAERRFDVAMSSPEAAVAEAAAQTGDRPAVLADVQDNPGAGASSDSTGLLRALVAGGARGALLGLMHDPALAAEAHRLGVGAEIAGAMGGRSGVAGDAPFRGRFGVESLSDGRFRYAGAMYGGGTATLGPSCALRVLDVEADIRAVVTSRRDQCLDLAQFRHFGLRPETARIVCVKSTAHFRADFEPIASRVIPVAAPGAFPCDPAKSSYRNLRKGVRLGPSPARSD